MSLGNRKTIGTDRSRIRGTISRQFRRLVGLDPVSPGGGLKITFGVNEDRLGTLVVHTPSNS